VSKFSIGAILDNNRDAGVIVIGNDVIRLDSLLAATGNEDLPGGFGLPEMLDHWDVWFVRTIASMCAESFVTQKLPVPTGLANRLLPAAAFVLCTQKPKLGCIQP
jgi:hypothetical protein